MSPKRHQIDWPAGLMMISLMMCAASSARSDETQTELPDDAPAQVRTEPQFQPSLFDGIDARLGSWSGALGFNYMDGTQSMSGASSSGAKQTNSLMRETLKIVNSGYYLLNPRLCQGNMELDLAFDQDKSEGSGSSTTTKGTVIGYAIDAEILSEKPYTASLFANRNENRMLQPFGGLMVGVNENRGAIFRLRQDSILTDWGYPWFEASLDLHEDHNSSTTTSFGNSQFNDQTSRTAALSASKGFETADLDFNYQYNDVINPEFKEGNFQSRAAALTYSVDFGPTLNRRFDSMWNYLVRDGTAGTTTMTNSEHLHIDHYENLNTDYQYGYNYLSSGNVIDTVQNAAFSVSHQLYKNLFSSAGVNGSRSTMQDGSTTSEGGHLGESYHHSLPGNGNFSMSWSGSYQLDANNLSSSSVLVIDEAHFAPNPFGAGVGFLLNHNFAVASSVVVTNVRGGGRIPLTVGIDYDVIDENNQVKIVPLAGSLLVLPGDPLVVNYSYMVDGNLKYSSLSTGYGMMLDYHWVSVSFNHLQSTQKPLNGSSSIYLQDTLQNTLQVNLQGTLLDMETNANMGLENFESNTSVYRRSKLSSSLIWGLQSNMRAIFGVNASDSNYTVPTVHTDSTRSARSSLNWFTSDGWNNTASIDWSTYKDNGTPPETLVQAIAQSGITLGLFSLNASIALGEWTRDGNRSTNKSFSINIVRQLR